MVETIGKYKIIRRIGTGGFGAVYEGRDPFLKRPVAVKTCQIDDEEVRTRFFREAELAGSLHHRNITTVFDSGVERGMPFLVQEFLNGEDLDRTIARREPLPVGRKLEILIGVAYGLEHAHAAGVIHRDVKPANVRVLEDGTVKIMDFGIAKSLRGDLNMTDTGATLGTSAYLAPEQIRGQKADKRTDIFALGILAYELLTGRKPFTGESLPRLFDEILAGRPTPIRELAAGVPDSLVAAVERAMRTVPAQRYSSISELRADLIATQKELRGQAGAAGPRPEYPASAEATPCFTPALAGSEGTLPHSAQTAELPLDVLPPPIERTGATSRARRGSRRLLRAASVAALVFLALSGALVFLWPSPGPKSAPEASSPPRPPEPARLEVALSDQPAAVAPDSESRVLARSEPRPSGAPRRAARRDSPPSTTSERAEKAGQPRIVVRPSARTERSPHPGKSGPLPRDRYTRAATAPGLSNETRAYILLQSALDHHAAGNDERAQASLRAAFSLSPELRVAAEAYGARFARLAETVRGAGGE